MRVTIFGSGYVGLVTGACLADAGNDVLCVDVDEKKIEGLKQGIIPIHEPGLESLIKSNVEAERLKFTTSAKEGVGHGLFQLIAVGTPPDEDGSADLKYVLAVARSIGEHMNEYKVVITKSTVPVGTSDKVRGAVEDTLRKRGAHFEYDVVSNPEFLKEGAAIEDFMRPDRVVVGTDNPRVTELLRTLYDPFTRNREKVSVGIGSDPRIGYHFIYPGLGYGGSCFPKDVQALARSARGVGYEPRLLNSVEAVNKRQKEVLFDKISKHYGGDLKGKTIAMWGLAFKPGTDDMREAPARVLLEQLWKAGAKVRAFDPAAMKETTRIYGER